MRERIEILSLLLLAMPQIPVAAQGSDYALSPPQIWIRAWALKTPLLMARDIEGNMVDAQRTNVVKSPGKSDTVSLSFRGTGATPEPTGDFSDLAYITSDGLTRGIETVKMP